MTEDGPLAPSSLSIFLVGGSFILAAMMHPQEFWCLPHGIIYYITIPDMYLLLVIYSIFNLVFKQGSFLPDQPLGGMLRMLAD